ncbi:unnamed protein product [Penicillium roqueforti FM164]|uniref:Genomic scaffold, ProqFM164S02 n=1 Tax=Penicillium roqueforti (strain FM164) TaxID=1365484 RepID=W6Q1I1_PENRF|nr:unnamed protein product [Penicillium roqueforti FM164]
MHASHEDCSPNFVHPLNMHMRLKMITARTSGNCWAVLDAMVTFRLNFVSFYVWFESFTSAVQNN